MNTRLLSLALACTTLLAHSLRAAEPESGSVNPGGPVAPWDGKFTGTAIGTGTVVVDTFILTVQSGDYTNKVVKVKVSWTLPSSDYDLAIFKRLSDGSNGPQMSSSGSGIPLTEEIASIDPNATGPGVYNIDVIYFANTPDPVVDPPRGEVTVVDIGPPRAATYLKGGMTFSPNSTCKGATSIKAGEPSSRIDVFGNYY
ncbi:MAG TPA: hypothetical protein VG095_09955, partial [Chthoniobacterales bacterium]|nr:hypothetical protein [Chthoniobacterales bacterium]